MGSTDTNVSRRRTLDLIGAGMAIGLHPPRAGATKLTKVNTSCMPPG